MTLSFVSSLLATARDRLRESQTEPPGELTPRVPFEMGSTEATSSSTRTNGALQPWSGADLRAEPGLPPELSGAASVPNSGGVEASFRPTPHRTVAVALSGATTRLPRPGPPPSPQRPARSRPDFGADVQNGFRARRHAALSGILFGWPARRLRGRNSTILAVAFTVSIVGGLILAATCCGFALGCGRRSWMATVLGRAPPRVRPRLPAVAS